MNEFLRHEPCTQCGSRDNLAIYADGHSYCFGCHTYTLGTAIGRFNYLKNRGTISKEYCLQPPPDCSYTMPEQAIGWLRKYGITVREILVNRISWSQERESLILPAYGNKGELLLYQERYFGADKSRPKYLTRGSPKEVLHVLYGKEQQETVVLVEDLISAIKVGRQFSCLPLWGSFISNNLLRRLSLHYPKLIIWLDKDKQSTYPKLLNQASLYFESIKGILSEKDPKEYLDGEIASLVGKEVPCSNQT